MGVDSLSLFWPFSNVSTRSSLALAACGLFFLPLSPVLVKAERLEEDDEEEEGEKKEDW